MVECVIQDYFLDGGNLDSHGFIGRTVGSDQGFGSGPGGGPRCHRPGQPPVRGGGIVGGAHGRTVARLAAGGRLLEQPLPALLALVEGRGMGESFQDLSRCPDFEYVMLDSTIVRAHQHAAGAKGGLGIRPSGARAGD